MPIGTERADPRGEPSGDGSEFDYDVVIIGGGPSGASAGIFTARAGMNCCILDRGPASLARCAYLENYLGFPGGIDVATFRALCRDHAKAAGCRYVPDMARAIRHAENDRRERNGTGEEYDDGNDGESNGGEHGNGNENENENGDGDGDRDRDRNGNGDGDRNRNGNGDGDRESERFVVETADGRRLKTPRVVATTKDDTDYLDALGEEAMFAEGSYDGESYRYFDAGYVDETGRTPISGLYVAGPLAGCLDQVVASAGDGATVGFSVIADWLTSRGYPAGLARGYWDWLSKEETRDDEWAANARKFVESSVPDDTSDERIESLTTELRAHTDALFVDRKEVTRRRERGQRRLLGHLDDEVIRAYLAERDEPDDESDH